MSASVYGVWTSCDDHWSTTSVPTFYVEGRLKEGDIVCRVPDWLTESVLKAKDTAADKETGKVTYVMPSVSKAGNLTCHVRVKWTKRENDEAFQWGDVCGHPLQLVL